MYELVLCVVSSLTTLVYIQPYYSALCVLQLNNIVTVLYVLRFLDIISYPCPWPRRANGGRKE